MGAKKSNIKAVKISWEKGYNNMNNLLSTLQNDLPFILFWYDTDTDKIILIQ